MPEIAHAQAFPTMRIESGKARRRLRDNTCFAHDFCPHFLPVTAVLRVNQS
jgi:hypothetical protein